MNNRKSIFTILLTVLGIILFYNYMIAPLLLQSNSRMGMGMHWRMANSNQYFVDMRVAFIILLALAGLILFDLLRPGPTIKKCTNCDKLIESERWKVCPRCGKPITNGKGGGK